MKRFVKVLSISAMMAAAMATAAYAETITEVVFTCGAPEDDTISTGITSPEFTADEATGYELASYADLNEDSEKYKNPHTYELVFNAESGYEFPEGASVTVKGSGITEITRKKMEDDGSTLIIRCKAYPYYQMPAPDDISGYDNFEKKISWDKNGGSNFEYCLTYEDSNGDEHQKHGTTSSSNVSISAYNKEYKGTNEDKQDTKVTGFAVRTIASSTGNPRVAPSDWAGDTGIVDDFEVTNYESWADLGMGKATGSAKNTTTAGPGSSTSKVATGKNGWDGSGDTWRWYENGNMKTNYWVNDGGNWYWIGADGIMKSGWQWDGNYWYYMNQQHDGTFGRMMSGWINLNGVRYYLNTQHDGTFGRMFTGTHTIDGQTYTFNDQGALQ
ncbi:MAG: hypothetical protein IIY96_07575 [Lachnospiraceae bacterium]|nr:hypothetical protein [Lachnospiraceae bacterium]